MTGNEQTAKRADSEPVFGQGIGWLTAPLHRIGRLLFIDVPSPSGVWMGAALWIAYKQQDPWTICHLALASVYFAARKYFGPIVEAICERIKNK